MLVKSIQEKHNTEIALIILCCRRFVQTADDNAIRIFLQENIIEWKRLYQLSEAHRIRPVIYKTLFLFKDIIGKETLEEFRNYCMYLNAFALNNKHELYRIVELLRQNSIKVKPYKGIDFSENFYGDIGLREFSDNDLIIMTSDILETVTIMNKEGYSSKGFQYYTKFPKQYIKDNKDIVFEKSDKYARAFSFEFHYKTSYSFQGYPYSFSDVLGTDFLNEVRKYNETDYLKLMSISNGLMDHYPNLRSILDVAVIIKKYPEINVQEADPLLKTFINYGLLISNELFDYPILLSEKNQIKSVVFINSMILNILNRKADKRIKLLKYTLNNISNTASVGKKIMYLTDYLMLLIKPNVKDIREFNFRYYSFYYISKPLRHLIELFRK